MRLTLRQLGYPVQHRTPEPHPLPRHLEMQVVLDRQQLRLTPAVRLMRLQHQLRGQVRMPEQPPTLLLPDRQGLQLKPLQRERQDRQDQQRLLPTQDRLHTLPPQGMRAVQEAPQRLLTQGVRLMPQPLQYQALPLIRGQPHTQQAQDRVELP